MSPFFRAGSSSRRGSAAVSRDRHADGARPFRRSGPLTPSVSTEATRARLSFVLLVYVVAMVALIQLAPFGFILPSDIHVVAVSDWRDAFDSVFLFVPLGFLYPLTRTSRRTSSVHVALGGALLGALIAAGRICEADRDVAIADVAASALGACVGGLLLEAVNHRTRASARLANRLSLEIPLAGLVYLLLGVLVATGFSAHDDIRRLLLVLPLGLLGARLLAGLQQHHFGPAHVLTARGMSLVAVGWMVLGVFPTLLRHPLFAVGCILFTGLATFYHLSRPVVHFKERRFEADVLKGAMPYVVVYFLDVALLPLAGGFERWHFQLGLAGGNGDVARQVMQLLELVASLTLLGYLLAETRGRRELPFARVALRVAMECCCVAIAIEASRGFQRQVGASALECLLMVCAAVLGAGMYHHQRERVRWLLIHRLTAAPERVAMRPRAWVRMAD
jgi:hypothetical protein